MPRRMPCSRQRPPVAAGALQLLGRYDKPESLRAAPQTHVDREQAAPEDVCERDVFRVVGLRPTKLVRKAPGLIPDAGVLDAGDRRTGEHGAGRESLLGGQIAAPLAVMQDRVSLRPHERWSDESLTSKSFKAGRCDARLDSEAGVNCERQRPWRDSSTHATTFGIGSPQAVCSQPQLAGTLAISGGPCEGSASLSAVPFSPRAARISTIGSRSESGSASRSFWAFSRVVMPPILSPRTVPACPLACLPACAQEEREVLRMGVLPAGGCWRSQPAPRRDAQHLVWVCAQPAPFRVEVHEVRRIGVPFRVRSAPPGVDGPASAPEKRAVPRLPACTPLWSVLPCLRPRRGCGGRPRSAPRSPRRGNGVFMGWR